MSNYNYLPSDTLTLKEMRLMQVSLRSIYMTLACGAADITHPLLRLIKLI